MKRLISISIALIMLAACGGLGTRHFEKLYGKVDLNIDRRVDSLNKDEISFQQQVEPILVNRCDACHSCFDAPCQLKLTSFEGLERGASKILVYDGARLTSERPTRLFIDARTTEEWRQLNFHPVLNERDQVPLANAENSLVYQMLQLKKENPLPLTELLPASFDISLDRNQQCPEIEEFEAFKKKYPLWGMPYGLPGLTVKEHGVMADWVRQGATILKSEDSNPRAANLIKQWEEFFNGKSLKQQLVSRYIYEHLFIGHIRFDSLPDREFYRLVRSYTPPGMEVEEINTTRPYDSPGDHPFYYRFRRVGSTIVAKNHTVYTLSREKMDRYRELFLTPGYRVDHLPSYSPKEASNPLQAFAAIPAQSRYRFLLDDARFFIMGFIKGPVCRGQIALNVINDHFFVCFFDPDRDKISNDTEFVESVSPYLKLPAERGNTLNIMSIWYDFYRNQKKYLDAKEGYLESLHPDRLGNNMTQIWDGDGHNPNAFLTVFRHFDSATVVHGFVGQYPKTGWVIDYPLFERIHYLLVAGFDVHGNVGHQLITRLYMDFLRMEAENAFLSFLPSASRKKIRSEWYKGAKAELSNYLHNPHRGIDRETRIEYSSNDPKTEFFKKIISVSGKVSGPPDRLNRGDSVPDDYIDTRSVHQRKADSILSAIPKIRGPLVQNVNDVTFLHILTDDGENDLAYTIVRNRILSNLSSLFNESRRRETDQDSLTVVKGHLGTYPNSFVRIHIDELDAAITDYMKITDKLDYYNFARKYVISRTSPDFWREYDWHVMQFAKSEPVEFGLFDLNRYSRIAEKKDREFQW